MVLNWSALESGVIRLCFGKTTDQKIKAVKHTTASVRGFRGFKLGSGDVGSL